MNDLESFTQIALILAAAFIGGALFNRFKQPFLVGYILVGIILGPSVLGIIHDQGQIRTMAELGILLLLFLAGLELNIKLFAPVARIATLTTLAQIFASLVIIALVGFIFDWPWQRILLIGFAVSMSSSAVSLSLLERMRRLRTCLGRTSIGITIAQDVAVIPMLLVIGLLGASGKTGLDWAEVIKIVTAFSLMGVLLFLLYKNPEKLPGAKTLKKYSREFSGQRAIAALALCFTGASISGLLGLSASYGAFLTGLILGNILDKRIFENDTRPIFDVLIMVFFLSIGLLIDINFVVQNLATVLLLVILVLMTKTAVNVILLRMQGMSQREAFISAAALGQIGEFSFVLAALGLSIGMIAEDGYKYTIVIIALSLMLTPVWTLFVRRIPVILYKRQKKVKNRHG